MYETHFGMRQRPFRSTPDSGSYYPATSHERALSQLLQAIAEDEGLTLLTGDPGTGKTVLGHCFLDRLDQRLTGAFLTQGHFGNRTGFLQAILYDLSLPYEGRTEQELRLTLTDFLLKNYEAGQRTVLVIDEAQHLTPDLLEELRLLGNLEGRNGKALQVILLALPAILDALGLPELAAFNQRLVVRARVEPLGLHEAVDYLVHHLRAAGARPEHLVSDEALEVLARGTQGVPRLLNQAAHQALRLAYSAGATMLDAEAALEALASLGLADAEELDRETAGPEASSEAEDLSPTTTDEPTRQPVLALEPSVDEETNPHPHLPRDAGRSRRLFVAPRQPA
jgi:type II secretory pathway predicted ATPase ExeA